MNLGLYFNDILNKAGYRIESNKIEHTDLSLFREILKQIDENIHYTSSKDIPRLFREVPVEVFGSLIFDMPDEYPNMKTYFPKMVSKENQLRWTGSHGKNLLDSTISFVKTLSFGYSSISGKNLENSKVLDYGCGWGRIIRFLYKYLSTENIYALDPMKDSIDALSQHNVRANIAQCEDVPNSLPFKENFDLIFSFSVFTHLSEKTTHAVLKALRNNISDNGVLVITTRPVEFWKFYKNGIYFEKCTENHNKYGFSFIPEPNAKASKLVDGDVTYGDTSISYEYLKRNISQWEVVMIEHSAKDPFQIIYFLTPI